MNGMLGIIYLFSSYVILGLLLRSILGILPPTFSKPFEITARNIRDSITGFANAIFPSNKNLEANILIYLVSPFTLLLLIISFLSYIISLYPDLVALNLYLTMISIALLAFLAPTPDEINKLLMNSAHSSLVLLAKITIIIQYYGMIPEQYRDLAAFAFFLFPLSIFLDETDGVK